MQLGTITEKYDRLVIFDTETTGLHYSRDEIIEFAAIVVEQRDGKATVIREYDELESKLFSYCLKTGMYSLFEVVDGEVVPSAPFEEGGIQEAIMDYEDAVFFDILAEELARRDMDYKPVSRENYDELVARMDEYIAEFEAHGTDNILIDSMDT